MGERRGEDHDFSYEQAESGEPVKQSSGQPECKVNVSVCVSKESLGLRYSLGSCWTIGNK